MPEETADEYDELRAYATGAIFREVKRNRELFEIVVIATFLYDHPKYGPVKVGEEVRAALEKQDDFKAVLDKGGLPAELLAHALREVDWPGVVLAWRGALNEPSD